MEQSSQLHQKNESTASSPEGGFDKTSLANVQRMHKEIKQLHEKRQAAMMNEVVELQRERDTAVGRAKILNETIKDLTLENNLLKNTIGKGDLVQRLFHIEKSLLEEQLYSTDLKKKLQAANKQIAALQTKLKSINSGQQASIRPTALLSVANDSLFERSLSMNDLEEAESKQESPVATKDESPPAQYHLPRLNMSNQKASSPTASAAAPLQLPKVTAQNLTPSPSIIARRYKLATSQSRTIGVQADLQADSAATSSIDTSSTTDTKILYSTIETLKAEKKELVDELSELKCLKEKEVKESRKQYKDLKSECDVLRDSLSEFSRWVRQKIHVVEEDIDICRVIYSLHGSLSQEAALLRDLQNRLGESDEKIAELEAANRQLRETVDYTEEKYKQAKQQIGLLKEKIVLLTPTKSMRIFSPTDTSNSPPQHRQQHYLLPSSPSSSPLLQRKARQTSRGSGGGLHHQNMWTLSLDDNNVV